jgi:hypothetical protein
VINATPLTKWMEGGGTLRLHNNRFAAFQLSTDGLNFLPRDHINEFAELLSDFNLLASVDGKLEVLWCFEDQDDGAAEPEPTHLLSGSQGLAMQDGRSGGVHCLTIGPRGREPSVFVGSEVLCG